MRIDNLGETLSMIAKAASVGDRKSAVSMLYKLFDFNSTSSKLTHFIANTAVSLGEFSLASSAALKHLNAGPDNVENLLNCCAILAECGQFDQVTKLLAPALARKTVHGAVQHLAGTIFQQRGMRDQARELLLNSLSKSNDTRGITWLTLATSSDFAQDEELFARIVKAEGPIARSPDNNKIPYYFARGKAELDRGLYDQAFDTFSTGAKLARKLTPYDADAEQQLYTSITRSARGAREPVKRSLTNDSTETNPIFIAGLPRSGTTLLEQILTNHEKILDGGEFGGMRWATMQFGGVTKIPLGDSHPSTGTTAPFGEIANLYRDITAQRYGSNGITVDKSINNSLYLGIITNAFPDSPIIHIERSFEDIAWSCFRTCFNRGNLWSNSLNDIANHFELERQLMATWKNCLGDRVYTVNYEDLVREPETEIPRILDACGLTHSEAVFKFHESERAITTSSTHQVRQPLYQTSVSSSSHVRHRMGEFTKVFGKKN
ncbi:sulfotransferase [Microbulbifer elongatus]|uniref:sulfotransferase n=1 Tax=Microbulbifer elongatus TaxID=86173 RepID=UPI001CFC8CA7|nr:sulfotransferase [Microbulbifer elongatus]